MFSGEVLAMVERHNIPSVVDEVGGYIDAFDDLADSIANPPEGRPLRAAIGRGGQEFCNAVGSVPGQVRARLGGSFWTAGLLCKPYWDKNGYDAPVEGPPPFEGGQCPVAYEVGVIRQSNGARVAASPSSLVGPIVSFTIADEGAGPSGTLRKRFTFVGSNGSATAAVNVPPATPGLTPDIYRVDGQPDSCGDLPGEPMPGPNPPPTPAPWPPGGGPGLDPSGRPYFEVPDEDPNIPGEEPVPVPDPNDGPGDGGSTPAGEPEPGAPEGTGSGGAAEGDAPEGTELWALRVDIAATPEGAKTYAPGVYRGVCYVYMGDSNGLDHDPAGAMLRDGQLILAERNGLTKWRVSANVGYSLTITPFWRTPEEIA